MHLHRFSFKKDAFTLIELLAVMSIIAILAYLTIPALSSMGGARSINQGIDNISSILQLARSEAVTRQSYVWVGFSQGFNSGGQSELTMVAASSIDGSTNSVPSNLVNLTRPIRVEGVVMNDFANLKAATRALFTDTTISIGGSRTGGITFPSETSIFTNTVTFTPRGEAMINPSPTVDDPYNSFLDVSFRQANTGTPTPDANDASVILDGGTGAVQTIRLK